MSEGGRERGNWEVMGGIRNERNKKYFADINLRNHMCWFKPVTMLIVYREQRI